VKPKQRQLLLKRTARARKGNREAHKAGLCPWRAPVILPPGWSVTVEGEDGNLYDAVEGPDAGLRVIASACLEEDGKPKCIWHTSGRLSVMLVWRGDGRVDIETGMAEVLDRWVSEGYLRGWDGLTIETREDGSVAVIFNAHLVSSVTFDPKRLRGLGPFGLGPYVDRE